MFPTGVCLVLTAHAVPLHRLHRCTEVLLTALAAKEAGTKEKIKEIWKEDPKCQSFFMLIACRNCLSTWVVIVVKTVCLATCVNTYFIIHLCRHIFLFRYMHR